MKLKDIIKRHPKEGWGPVSAVTVTLIVFFVSQIIAGIFIAVYPLIRGWNSVQTDSWLNTIFAQFLLVLLIELTVLAMLYWFLRNRSKSFKDLGLIKFKWVDIAYALAGFAVYFIGFIIVTILVKVLLPNVNLEQEQQIGFEGAKSTIDLAVVFVSLVILPPFTEEVLARGFLYTGLRSKLSFIKAGLITSVFFAAAHLQFGSGAPLLWIAAIDTFILSLVLVYLREKTSSLWPSILLHGLKNSLAFAYLFIIR